MYRTDKRFMKDPSTAASRIYIGGISETVSHENLEEKFKAYGKILGLILQRGFGFIQYEHESEAQAAIRAEHGVIFRDRKLIVRQALDNRKHNSNQPPPNTPPPQNNPLFQNKPPPVLLKPLLPQNKQPLLQNPTEANEPPVQNKPLVQNKPQVEPEMIPSPLMETDTSSIDKRNNKRKYFPRVNERHQPMDNYRDMYYEESFHAPAYMAPIMDRPERNDCEIIVVSKLLTEYAEYIERRLKAVGLMVDLLFPNEDVPIGKVLANISSRGCLYAILIMPQNEEHRSLTLNILHGLPQEHRNMPIEDSFILIRRNFDAYMRGEKLESDILAVSLTDKHPEPMQMLFNLLAENRQLAATQYDRIIKYLYERRELQRKYEGNEEGAAKAEPESDTKQAELQNRIMNILNKSTDSKPQTPTDTQTPTPLLNDPSVQKALDSLMLGDMFKSISAGV